MKKIFIFISLILLSGCLSVSSDGGLNVGMRGSVMWDKTSSQEDKANFYSSESVSKLCKRWNKNVTRLEETDSESFFTAVQNMQISLMSALEKKGLKKNHCGDFIKDDFASLEERWVNLKTNQSSKTALAVCEASAKLARLQAKARQESINDKQEGKSALLGAMRGLTEAAAGNDAYQAVLQGCMADKGYLKQKVRVTVD